MLMKHKCGFPLASIRAIVLCLFFVSQAAKSQQDTAQTVASANIAEIYLLRPEDPSSRFKFPVKLGSEEIGAISPRGYAIIHVEPGRHKIQVEPTAAAVMFSNIAGSIATVELECKAGERYYISYTTRSDSNWVDLAAVAIGIALKTRVGGSERRRGGLNLVSSETGRQFVNRHALAFVHGRAWPADLPDVVETIDVPDGKNMAELHNAILAAAQKYSWTIQGDTLGKLILHQANKRWDCTLAIVYNANNIYIHCASARNGKKAVPSGWIANMRAGILDGLGVERKRRR